MAREKATVPEVELKAFLVRHKKWRVEGGQLARTYEAPTFLEGIGFVHEVARLAEVADHHPDIDIRYRRVTLRFVTHDAGDVITKHDLKLATECDLVFASRTRATKPS